MGKVKETKDYFWFEIDGRDLEDKKAMQKHTKFTQKRSQIVGGPRQDKGNNQDMIGKAIYMRKE